MHRNLYLLPILLVCVRLSGAGPSYEFVLRRSEDQIAVVQSQSGSEFLVTSSTGIGQAKIKLTSGEWPKHVTLKFQYDASRPFTRLESFALSSSRWLVRGSSDMSGAMPFYLPDPSGSATSTEGPAGTLAITVTQDRDAFIVSLPTNLLVGTTEVEVRWVDFFRK